MTTVSSDAPTLLIALCQISLSSKPAAPHNGAHQSNLELGLGRGLFPRGMTNFALARMRRSRLALLAWLLPAAAAFVPTAFRAAVVTRRYPASRATSLPLASEARRRAAQVLDEVRAVWDSDVGSRDDNRRAVRQMVVCSKTGHHTGISSWVLSQGPMPQRTTWSGDTIYVFGYDSARELATWGNLYGPQWRKMVEAVEDTRRPERGERPCAVRRSKGREEFQGPGDPYMRVFRRPF